MARTLSDYTTSIQCLKPPMTVAAGNGHEPGQHPGRHAATSHLHDHQQPQHRLAHGHQGLQSTTAPAEAVVDLQIDDETEKPTPSTARTPATKTVNTGNHSVGEVEVDGTHAERLHHLDPVLEAADDRRRRQRPRAWPASRSARGDVITCTITNSRNTGSLTVIKDFSRQLRRREAVVDLQIDDETEKTDALDGEAPATKTVNTGNHSVGEVEVDGTHAERLHHLDPVLERRR